MTALLNTLYVTTQETYLRKDHETVVVEHKHKRLTSVPLQHLGAIVCFGNVTMSPWLMHAAATAGIAIAFLSERGKFLARVEGEPSGNVLLRREQYRQADDLKRAAAHAAAFVLGKLVNFVSVLRRAAREHADPDAKARLTAAADRIGKRVRPLSTASDLNVIRGIEGDASAVYFSVFNDLVRRNEPELRFERRTRRPPLDRVNALLSFLYVLVLGDCAAACNAVGLDPAVGYLHADRPGRRSLALDLMEELRPALADRVALTLFNRRQLDPKDFTVSATGAVRLTDDARKTVLVTFQNRKRDEITHPFTGERVAFGLISHLQARLLARVIRGDLDAYPPFALK